MEIFLAYNKLPDVLSLIEEYTDMILSYGDDVKQCLAAQHLDAELEDIQRKYALPFGRLYLCTVNGEVAGCVGLTRNDDDFCEIKRLYVRPQFRGHHLSQLLLEKVISEAKTIGYKHMRLDTFPFMTAAIHLYEKYGFYYIDRYNDNPADSAIFMQLDLF